jgi:hypothetical protein
MAVDGYGYADQQIERNRYRVSFAGNSVTPRDTVQDYLLYRAAQLTRETGHDHFTIVDQDVERSTVYQGTGFGSFGGAPYDRGWVGGGLGSYDAYPIDSYTAFADIVVASGPKPEGNVNAYDAADVLRQLAPTVVWPEPGS